ncbi:MULTISPECIES: Uma2 family endonuclease [Leptolyngbya]|uniref:Uma2 family endonuclease n=1 Tax=Leptolyngbya TaxID=47251 RepID=UPI0016876C47|nr:MULTISPECIES: Uma2 family endonuclease [unclassified Leptolyngbya]MBD1859018.1 Uma2 family endonuclease [Leptolyngbya sp. FACHB-1624]MBN8563863.1 Uma2 family endonuclease [Leptolyngbya sp. UWPOB_LEPTO1]MCY6494172.1 Uma2 family endonuclease [Leptolyngbya sp. GGD]
MTQASDRVRWTTEDLKLLPDSSSRYEIIDGHLLMTRAPHWKHQKAIGQAYQILNLWSISSQLGQTVPTPGIIFDDADNVIPDVIWMSHERLAAGVDEEGHFTIAPELIIEVLSPGTQNERRDRETKLKLYAERGVQEYWILDWRLQQLEVYDRQDALLKLSATLFAQDTLTSRILPNFSCAVTEFFR